MGKPFQAKGPPGRGADNWLFVGRLGWDGECKKQNREKWVGEVVVVGEVTSGTELTDANLVGYTIPNNVDDLVDAGNNSQRHIEAHSWRTAALVYAWTEPEQGKRTDLAQKGAKLSLSEFADLNIRGLSKRDTVAKYRKAMQKAIDSGWCKEPEPGKSVLLPSTEFPQIKSLPANYSSESVEWYTPEEYIRAVHDVLGNVDLDPASCSEANETVGATEIFTQEDDGLTRDWHGNVFLNPPYGKDGNDSLAGIFCRKAIDEHQAGRVVGCIILVNSLHSQEWQRPLWQYPVCLVDHRIKFVSGDGTPNKNPTFQNAFFYLGPDVERFAEVFSRFGYVMKKVTYAVD